MMKYDLHSHSIASDGTLTPAQLVSLASSAGVDVLALTDHDTTDGIGEALQTSRALGVRLIAGVEISVTWHALTIHVLGLNVDRCCRMLQDGLRRLREFRAWRAREIGRRLERAGIQDAFEGARTCASGSIVGRTHFARFLVAGGHARSLQDVFRHFLVRNRPGYVPGEWAHLDEAVGWIRAAGGMAVIAHPARYRLSASRLRCLLEEFRQCGGVGLEVVSGSHTADDIRHMARYARHHDLLASSGSDFHGPDNPRVRLGGLGELPSGCIPLWSSEQWPVSCVADQPPKADLL
jgi:predicted metal-dependent phosphoesterase TrpH